MSDFTNTYYVDYTFYDRDTGYCNDYMKIKAHTKMEAYEIFTKDHAPSSLVDVDSIKTEEEVDEEYNSFLINEDERKVLEYATKNHIEGLEDYKKSIYSGEEIINAVDKQIADLNNFRSRIGMTRV